MAVVHLEPGESREVELLLASRAFTTWDVSEHTWVEREGVFRAAVGRSSRDLRSRVELVRSRNAVGHEAADQAAQ